MRSEERQPEAAGSFASRNALRERHVRLALVFAAATLALFWLALVVHAIDTPDVPRFAAWAVVFHVAVGGYTFLVVRDAMSQAATAALAGSEEQRRAAEAQREYFAQLVHNSSDAIISRSLDGTILSWNGAAERLFGYTAEEAVGRSVEIIVPSDDLQSHRLRRDQSASTTEPRESVRITKDGRRIDVEINTAPVRTPDGEIAAVSIVARDITAAKRARAALRDSERRLRDAQRLAHTGSWELDLATGALTWSEEIYRIFEIDPAAFGASYEAFLERVHPADREAVHSAYTNSVTARRPYSIDHRLLMADGRVKHVHEECETEYDEADKPVRSLGTVQDITERKIAEEARARLATIVQHANDAIISRTLDGNFITSWNAAAERLFGYTAAEAIGQPMAIIASARPRRIGENTATLKRGELVPDFESMRPHRNGTLIPVLNTVSPIFDEAGAITGVAVIIRDLREQKKAEAHRTLVANVFENAAEGIIITDADNRIVSINRAFTRITGYSFVEVAGKNPRIFASGLQSAEFYREMWDAINMQRVWHGELWDRRKNGELYYQSLSVAAIVDASGAVQNYCAIFMDITARKNAELALKQLNAELEARVAERTRELETSNQLLQRANDELNAFSYSVSHDLRGPLRRVHGYTAMALEGPAGADPRTRSWLERIRTNTEAMGNLVEDLLRLSLATRKTLEVEDVDLTQIAQEVCMELREHDDKHDVEVAIQPGMNVQGDRALLRILLENLIGNALKFSARAAPARIEIGAQEADGISFFVKDNGAGFDMARAGELFVPFKRLHAADEYHGTGVGLSIVQRIVEKHGGRVWAEGQVGRGAVFRFTLATGRAAAGCSS